ncbi:MAG: SRPBCC family protein [Parvibaculum sp.]|uniref:SRPBCC family protein n=1 Tax=Parvibaculum sp. TaxID=2024848 RepID=UPI0025CCCBEF|nr:SRPBCC family protein [Parvibaculum sp.]MCE9649510.1 SRPBCC family protein [Parvibaculum sp.]
MNGKGQMSKVAAVCFERLLPGPIERVWDYLTKAELLPGWFGEGIVETRVGGEVRLMDGHIRGTVTQCRPPHMLAYTWNVFGPGEAVSPYPESYLTLSLEEQGDKVLLTLTHLPILERFEKQNAMGWHTFLDMIEAALRGDPSPKRADYMKKNAELYGIDLDNIAR